MSAPLHAERLTAVENLVYLRIVRAAEASDPCPTNGELIDAIGGIANNIAAIMAKLIIKGWITVESGSRWRVVTIRETGKSTNSLVRPEPKAKPRKPFDEKAYRERVRQRVEQNQLPGDDLAARIDRDQAALRAQREQHLIEEQRKYGLKRRGRLLDDMVA